MKPTRLKKFKFFIQLYDAIWSLPLAFAMFIASGLFLQSHFASPSENSTASGFYDPIFLQVAFYASCIQVFANFTIWMGMYFNFRGLHRYFFGSRDQESGIVINQSKEDFLKLTPWQRLSIFLVVFLFLQVQFLVFFSFLI